MFKAFMSVRDSDDDSDSSISDIMSAAKANMLECNERMSESESCSPLKEYLERAREVHSTKVHEQFTTWVSARKEKDPNWKFWADLFSMACCPIYLCFCPCVVDCGSRD